MGLMSTLPPVFIFKHEKDFYLVNLKHILQLAGSFQAYQGKFCLASVPLFGIQQTTSRLNEQNIPLPRQLPIL